VLWILHTPLAAFLAHPGWPLDCSS
jgi:hypothetical protein